MNNYLREYGISLAGGSCFRLEDCSGGAICQDNACICPTGTLMYNGECSWLSVEVQLNETCVLHQQCAAGLACVQGTCRIPSGRLQRNLERPFAVSGNRLPLS